ncbi:MAG: ABC transporter substrate-binding protein [Firmicutes bacterium]|nr:ABC transporter substrate-binding protein [Bacillota bacterium]
MGEAERLITQEKVAALTGCYHSNVTATASQAAERLGVPFVNPDSVFPPLIKRGYKWFFRLTPGDDTVAQDFMSFLKEFQEKESVELKTVAILWENSLWGTEAADIQRQLVHANGYELVADIGYSSKSTDVTSEVQKLKSANPDVLIQNSYIADTMLFLKTFEQMDFVPKMLLANGGGFSDTVFIPTMKEKSNYWINSLRFSLDIADERPLVKQVNDLYKGKYGVDMNDTSARAFMTLITLGDALDRAGKTEPEALRQALLATDIKENQVILPWKGVQFDPNTGANTLAGICLAQIQDQKYHDIWPYDLATAEVIFPIPAWSERK